MGKVFNAIDDLVSIVLPVYNIKKEYLIKCVESLINQTYSNIEIILVDDGSTNGIYKTCLDFGKIDERIVVLHQENLGVSVARNKGIEVSKGKYLCFVDPDDWVEKNYIEKLYNLIKRNSSDISMCACNVYYEKRIVQNSFLKVDENVKEKNLCGDEKNKVLYQLIGKKICDYYPSEIAAGVPWGKMFSMKFIKQNKLSFVPGMKRMQDNIFCLYAIEYAKKISYIDLYLYNYRKEFGSASHKYSPDIYKYFEDYYSETFKFLNKFNKEEVLFEALQMKELTSFNSYMVHYIFNKNNNISYLKKRLIIKKLLSQQPYNEAIQNINYKLLTKQEKVFVFCLKKHLFVALLLMVKIRSLIKF